MHCNKINLLVSIIKNKMVKSQYFQKWLEITSCTNGDCGDKAKFEWTTHNIELWVNCLWAYHITWCKFETLPYSVMEWIFDLWKKLISRISKFGTNHQLDQKYVGFSDSLNVLVDTYTKIKSKKLSNFLIQYSSRYNSSFLNKNEIYHNNSKS